MKTERRRGRRKQCSSTFMWHHGVHKWHHHLLPQLDLAPVAWEGPTSPALAFPLMSASSSLSSSLSFLMQSKYSFCLSRAWPHTDTQTDTDRHTDRQTHAHTRNKVGKREKRWGRGEAGRGFETDMQHQGGTARQCPHAKKNNTKTCKRDTEANRSRWGGKMGVKEVHTEHEESRTRWIFVTFHKSRR